MPGIEDLKGLAADMGLTGTAPTPPAPVPPTPEPTTPEPTPAPVAPTPSDPVPPAPTTPEPPKAPEPAPITNQEAAAQRIQNKKFRDAIAAAAKADGISEDEYLAKLQETALTKRATEQNVPPEILRRLEATEAELAQSREAMAQQHLSIQFNKIQNAFGLTNEGLTEFVNKLAESGHNFQNTNVDYELLYRGMYHNDLIAKERQKWITEAARAQATGSTPAARGGKGASPEGSKIDTLEALDALLDEKFKQ